MKRNRRRNAAKNPQRRKRGAPEVARFAQGRAIDAVDWVGGAGWQNPENGHLVIETIMALHHDQARCMDRCHRIISRQPLPSNKQREEIRLITMPVSTTTGDVIHARLQAWRRHPSDRWKRTVGRIGLGSEEAGPAGRVPLSFTQISTTARDGRPLKPIGPEAFAVLENDRVIGRIDAGKPQLHVNPLEREPQYAAGLGADTETENMPSIMILLAIGRTTAEAITRAARIYEGIREKIHPRLVLKISRISPMDGQMLRTSIERNLQSAPDDARHTLEIGIGHKDDLIDADEWCEVDEETRNALAAAKPSVVTVDGDGMPQIWDERNTQVNPYWGSKVQ